MGETIHNRHDVAKSIVQLRPSVHVKKEHKRKIKGKRDNANKNMLIQVNVCCNDTTLNIMYNESYSDEWISLITLSRQWGRRHVNITLCVPSNSAIIILLLLWW